MDFMPSLIGVVVLLIVGYLCGAGTWTTEPEPAALLTSGDENQYFCPREVVCQAIRVSDGYFPDWVIQSGAEVVIFPSPKITLQQGNVYVQATANDYLLKLQDGTILAVPVEKFETLYRAISPM